MRVMLEFSYIDLVAIMNDSSSTPELGTVIHEFGHLYGVKDHYGGTVGTTTEEMRNKYEDREYSEDCIYGENKFNSDVIAETKICDGCKSWIIENRNCYSN